jgi:hypothetical protein
MKLRNITAEATDKEKVKKGGIFVTLLLEHAEQNLHKQYNFAKILGSLKIFMST